MLLFVSSKPMESKPVKLGPSCKVKLPPMVTVLLSYLKIVSSMVSTVIEKQILLL